MANTPTTTTSPGPRPRRRGPVIAGAVAGGLLVLLGGAYGVGYALAGETLPPETTIEGVPVGRLAPAEAEAALAEGLAERESTTITLVAGEHEIAKAPADFGLAVDHEASVEAAAIGKSFNPLEIWEGLTGGEAHEAVVTRDDARLAAAASEIAQLTNTEPVNAELLIEGTTPSVQEATTGLAVEQDATVEALVAAYLEETRVEAVVEEVEADITTEEAQAAHDQVAAPALSAPITITAGDKTFEVTPEMIASSLAFEAADGSLRPVLNPDTLMEQASTALAGLGLKEPQDARIRIQDGKPTITPSVDGMGVTKEELLRAVSETMTVTDERTTQVAVEQAKASFTTEEAEALGVKEITGEFTTRFPATAYRVNNIGKSASLINNKLVLPGETFSMNAALGPRTLARGWMAGGAIDGGRVVERMGGGISQTTTTLFNAVFFAGLEDVYHKPHSLYFSRYPMGREATLDWNSVDLKFRNDTDYGVLIQAFTNNPKVGGQGTVTVRIWSTKVYDVKASEPRQSNFKDPGPAIENDSAICSPQSAMRGFTVDYNRLFYQGGKLVRTEPFRWTYNTLTPVECTNPNARPDRIER